MEVFVLPIIVMVVCGVIASSVARQKGRGEIRWFIVGFLLNILGPVFIFLLPPIPKPGVMKVCPQCAEVIKADARVCRYCGRELSTIETPEVG